MSPAVCVAVRACVSPIPDMVGCTTEYTRPVATGGIVKTIFPHNFPKNDAQDLKKWSRKTRPVFLYNL